MKIQENLSAVAGLCAYAVFVGVMIILGLLTMPIAFLIGGVKEVAAMWRGFWQATEI